MNISSIGLDCVGCASCENICSFKAISFVQNEEGFFYPKIDINSCTNCGLCLSHCPQNHKLEELGNVSISQKSFVAYSRLKKYYKRSASGGAFITLAISFLEQNPKGIVCGASFSEGVVRHVIVNQTDDLVRLQGSKYVQSQMDDVYKRVAKHIKDGGSALFSGTPCQVAGLYSFIGNKYLDRLTTIDIICHGVPSPGFLKKDLKQYVDQISDLTEIEFRKKHPFYKTKSQFCLSWERPFHRKSVLALLKANSVSLNRDPYFSLFSKGMTLRESCYKCHYTNMHRVGDITIGDCDSYRDYPHFHPNEATSAMIINTVVGNSLWEKTKKYFDYEFLDIEKEADVNKQLKSSFKRPIERNTIYNELNNKNICDLRIKYSKPRDVRYYLGRMLWLLLPPTIIKMVSKK